MVRESNTCGLTWETFSRKLFYVLAVKLEGRDIGEGINAHIISPIGFLIELVDELEVEGVYDLVIGFGLFFRN